MRPELLPPEGCFKMVADASHGLSIHAGGGKEETPTRRFREVRKRRGGCTCTDSIHLGLGASGSRARYWPATFKGENQFDGGTENSKEENEIIPPRGDGCRRRITTFEHA